MKQIDQHLLAQLIEAHDVSDLSFAELQRLFEQDKGLKSSLPDGRYQIDPRNGDIVLFVSSRYKRPHDTMPTAVPSPNPETALACPICRGETTGIVDAAALSQGMTFINKNLFPLLYPFQSREFAPFNNNGERRRPAADQAITGMHFLQWTSSQHMVDWHNLPLADGLVVLRRLAALEKTLLEPDSEKGGKYVLINKNYGRLVGSSLVHGHQQIALSSVMPRRFADNLRFADWQGETFTSYMLRENPADLVVHDYGAALLLVPYFMRRPYDMMLIVKDVRKKHLFQLTEEELTSVAGGWGDAIRVMMGAMPKLGREIAYNVIVNNGPGAGLYFEFLPYTQEMGGFEHLGLITCEGDPRGVVREITENK